MSYIACAGASGVSQSSLATLSPLSLQQHFLRRGFMEGQITICDKPPTTEFGLFRVLDSPSTHFLETFSEQIGGVPKNYSCFTKSPLCCSVGNQSQLYTNYQYTSVSCIAKCLGISRRTLYQRMQEFGLSVRGSYSTLNDEELDRLIYYCNI